MTVNLLKVDELFNILENNNIIPRIQIRQMKEAGIISPPLDPHPQKWWQKSFEFYFVLDLLPCHEYGPFYRIGDRQGDPNFWPQIGIPSDEFSERKCFYGLTKPRNVNEAQKLYAPKESKMDYIYEFTINVPRYVFYHNNPLLFIGPVKDAEGFQVNPNAITAKLIQLEIIAGNVKIYERENNDYSVESSPYRPFNVLTLSFRE